MTPDTPHAPARTTALITGASAGLGYLMLHANARVQIDLMFAALVTLAAIGVALYFAVDALLRRLVYWQPETLFKED